MCLIGVVNRVAPGKQQPQITTTSVSRKEARCPISHFQAQGRGKRSHYEQVTSNITAAFHDLARRPQAWCRNVGYMSFIA